MPVPEVKSIEKWVEEEKLNQLYHQSEGSGIPLEMLKRKGVNAKLSEKQARLYTAYINLIKCLPECYQEKLLLLVDLATDNTMTINGYARKQAIEAEGKRVSNEVQKKTGILGRFGI